MNRNLDRYKILNEIGKGSFGKVYKGIDKLTGEQVALKFIEKKYSLFYLRSKGTRQLKNLQQENELLKKIHHPNVIALKDVLNTQKEIVIVTDYAGRDLSGLIEEVKKFPLDKVKDYSSQILNAMLYLNENRIIHRDLKPQNILIKGNHIKICDFGFAKKLSASTNFLQSMKGTPLYLAPEIVRETKYTQKVDIWSFGCIIYELFTGRTPYYANTYQKLAPLIMYQPVIYPKDMPVDMKDLIASMLQKNPSSRPDWKQLKKHSFFKLNEALKQKISNAPKEIIPVEIQQKPYSLEKNNPTEEKQNNPVPSKEENHIESKVIQKIDQDNQLKTFPSEFSKIYNQLTSNEIDGKALRKDVIFFYKVKTVFHERRQLNPLITDELLETTIGIITQLIKMKKGKNIEKNNETQEDDDITKNQALIFGLLCAAKVQKNYDILDKELTLLARLVKSIFNGLAVNSQIDEEITEFVVQILLENSEKLPMQCIHTGLIVVGTMVNQAMTTLANSSDYFERMAEDKLLSKIVNIYRKNEKYTTILQLLKTIIHPVKDIQSTTGGNPHHLLSSKLEKTFYSLKQQVAGALLRTDFISETSPLKVYGQKSTSILNYCEVLLECLEVSADCRTQFLKHSYWTQFLAHGRLRAFIFAYNMIFVQKQNKRIIQNEQISKFTQQSHENKLVTCSILQVSYLKVKNKPDSKKLDQYKIVIVQSVVDNLFAEEQVKKKSCIEVYGLLQSINKFFDEKFIKIFFDIVSEISISEESKVMVECVQKLFKRICNPATSFRPNQKGLYWLMTLFTQSQAIKSLRIEKSVQSFFYECLSEFIRMDNLEYLTNEFSQKQVPKFVAKFIQCLNTLIDIEEYQSKSSALSLSALNMTKQIQNSGFYREMFMEGLSDEQMYELLRYCQKIISKTTAVADFVTFLGVKVLPMCKLYFNTKCEPLLVEIFIFMAYFARDHPHFDKNIIETNIVMNLKDWLTHERFSESIREKALYMIGNMAKNSQSFFKQFETHSVIEAITECLKKCHFNLRILKNTIYAIGNISYYNQKFYREIEPMIPYFSKAFEGNDSYLRSNLISTVSNLLRFSNIFLSQLIKTGLIEKILKLASQGQLDQSVAGLVMSLVKKMIIYEEFYEAFGVKDLKLIYQRKAMFGGEGNETIRKIKEVLMARGEFN